MILVTLRKGFWEEYKVEKLTNAAFVTVEGKRFCIGDWLNQVQAEKLCEVIFYQVTILDSKE